jgi:hypothetical protein
LVLFCVLPLATGCVSRAAPFDELDDAQVTILRLQQQQPQQQTQPVPGQQGATPMIPGLPLPPELQQMGQQLMQQWQQYLPPGMSVPGMTPGQQPGQPQQPPPRLYKSQWVISAEQPLLDEDLKAELLDILGDEESFQMDRGNCFYPGMAAIFMTPERTEPVEVVVSLSCNQAVGYGFPWPHPGSGFTPETHQAMTSIYQRLWGPVPPGA